MLKYACEDTHYLLGIYDVLRSKLIALGRAKAPLNSAKFLLHVLNKSRKICMSVYEKPELKDDSYDSILRNHRFFSSPGQLSVLKTLLRWRDLVSRAEDESPAYVCPNDVLFSIMRALPVSARRIRMVGRETRQNCTSA